MKKHQKDNKQNLPRQTLYEKYNKLVEVGIFNAPASDVPLRPDFCDLNPQFMERLQEFAVDTKETYPTNTSVQILVAAVLRAVLERFSSPLLNEKTLVCSPLLKPFYSYVHAIVVHMKFEVGQQLAQQVDNERVAACLAKKCNFKECEPCMIMEWFEKWVVPCDQDCCETCRWHSSEFCNRSATNE